MATRNIGVWVFFKKNLIDQSAGWLETSGPEGGNSGYLVKGRYKSF